MNMSLSFAGGVSMADGPYIHAKRFPKTSFGWPVALAAASLLVFSIASHAQSGKDDPKAAKPAGTATVRIELTGGDTKKPIADASVYLKFTEEKALRDRKIE